MFVITILLFKYIIYKSSINIYYKSAKSYPLYNLRLSIITFTKFYTFNKYSLITFRRRRDISTIAPNQMDQLMKSSVPDLVKITLTRLNYTDIYSI